MYKFICQQCGCEFERSTKAGNRGQPRRFCSKQCAGIWQAENLPKPPPTEKQREAGRQNNARARAAALTSPGLIDYLHSDRNPLRNPEVGRRGAEAVRERGFGHLTGGNGAGLTKSQQLLADRTGWPTEYIVPTGQKGGGIPSHYKLDLAHPDARTAVEIDGRSHRGRKVAEADARKTAWLESHGWTLIRLTNAEVEADPDGVASKLRTAAPGPLATWKEGTP